MSRFFLGLVHMLSLILVLGCPGCGFKGPLYLPEAKTSAQKNTASPVLEPAPDRPVPAQSAPPPK
jgi:predicted small lipoprotein YifL